MIFLKHGPQGKAGRLKGVFGMVKTNVMRLLDAARIVYETGTYEVDENDLSGSPENYELLDMRDFLQ